MLFLFYGDASPAAPSKQRKGFHMPELWPHIWAIPLLFVAGVAVGWMLRSAMVDSEGGADSSSSAKDSTSASSADRRALGKEDWEE